MLNRWSTERGSKIVLDTEHIKRETVNADGHKVEIDVDKIKINSCTVNGNNVTASLTRYQGQNVLYIGDKVINGVKHPLYIAIPGQIYNEVWGEYDRRQMEKNERECKAEKIYQEHRNMVMKAMQE